MEKINFSYNWNNKLDCKYFTTLRLTKKYNINDKIEISLKNKTICKGTIIDKKAFGYNKINNFIAGIDTGYSVQETKDILKRMYKNVDLESKLFYLYLIKKD